MSDLSNPSLPLLQGEPPPFAWPTPALPAYPAPMAALAATACSIEGLNGHSVQGELTHFEPAAGLLQLRADAPRRSLRLRLDQFRRLHLLQPLQPLQQTPGSASGTDSATDELTAQRPVQPFVLALHGLPDWHGLTIGHVELPCGLFLFEPLDEAGSLRRWFVPRSAYSHAELGLRLGQALVDQHSATPEQIRSALAEQQALRERRLGELLLVRQIITPEELDAAIEAQARMPLVRIGQALTTLGFISEAQLEDALVQQRSDRSLPLGELLLRRGLVSRADLQTALARKMGYPLVDVSRFAAQPAALARLPQSLATRLLALPLLHRAGRLVVAVEDPSHRICIDELTFATQCKVVPVLAHTGALLGAIERAYAGLARPDTESPHEPSRERPAARAEVEAMLGPAPAQGPALQPGLQPALQPGAAAAVSPDGIAGWVQQLLQQAQALGVSDIHIDCGAAEAPPQVRWRLDGRLRSYAVAAPGPGNGVLAWLKALAGLPAGSGAVAQQGRIQTSRWMPGLTLDLRLSTLPTQGATEDAVLHLLAPQQPRELQTLGLGPRLLPALQAAMQRRSGLLLCVGPAGAGKRSTLHALLAGLDSPERMLCSAEDEADIRHSGVRQLQVDAQADWNLTQSLRALVQADADVILLGALRDAQAAEAALQAALGGRLVLSTLPSGHTAEAVARLLDLGLNPYNLGDALIGVLAQRLVRRLCPHCREAHLASAEEEEELLREHLQALQTSSPELAPDPAAVLEGWRSRWGNAIGQLTLYRPVGCSDCGHSGWLGRTGIHEWLDVTPMQRRFIQTGHRTGALQRQALADGLLPLRHDGIEKVLAGVSTLDEVRAAC